MLHAIADAVYPEADTERARRFWDRMSPITKPDRISFQVPLWVELISIHAIRCCHFPLL